ncbi:phage holin family protein [Qiania dongpingensis]|uniref:Phage holin family protein n=1 Tax=Qiania dongpingensis TaxID=2763669 RepID=A0A7G9G6X9_9FIRM|nr:phage holin family protein [Qiania dongpingensis]QNM06561.1 phage holin family protein [Qiania dongpingensis]
MEFGTIGSVVGITVICYLAAVAVKATPLDNKWLPVICGVLGGILGVVGMRVIPDYPAGDYITAIAVGIVSGLAATGSNQVFKQLKNKTEEDKA